MLKVRVVYECLKMCAWGERKQKIVLLIIKLRTENTEVLKCNNNKYMIGIYKC